MSPAPRVAIPAVTTSPPAVTLTPVLAVTIPTESILVTSSYVKVPPIETVVAFKVVIVPAVATIVPPVIVAIPVTLPVTLPVKSPLKVDAVTIPDDIFVTVISGEPDILNAVFANPTLVPAPRVVIPVTVRLESVVPPVTESVPSFV